MDVYLNGQLDNGPLVGTVTAVAAELVAEREHRPAAGGGNFEFNGRIDDVRIYSRALTAAEIQADMNTPLGSAGHRRPDAADRDHHRARRTTRKSTTS